MMFRNFYYKTFRTGFLIIHLAYSSESLFNLKSFFISINFASTQCIFLLYYVCCSFQNSCSIMLNLPDIFFMCLTFLLIPYIYINYNYPKYCITYFVVNFTCIFNFRTYFSLWDFSSQILDFQMGASYVRKLIHQDLCCLAPMIPNKIEIYHPAGCLLGVGISALPQ